MTLSFTYEKKTTIKEISKDKLPCNIVTRRKLAKLLDNLLASFPEAKFRPLHETWRK